MSSEVLLNGRFVSDKAAVISVENRGVQFSESVYEVTRAYSGRPFEMGRHLRRFRASAEAIGLDLASSVEDLEAKSLELLRRSGLRDALIYMQATTGDAPRAHLRPDGLQPTVLAIIMPVPPVPERWLSEGITAITVSDDRWARCYVKTTMLLPNTLAKKRAAAVGCDDAIFVRDGFVAEATAGNVFAVFDGTLRTPPKSNYILHGITREVLLELAAAMAIPYCEEPIPVESLLEAEEMFMTGTAFAMVAITSLDGRRVGDGRPGPLLARLEEAYQRRVLDS